MMDAPLGMQRVLVYCAVPDSQPYVRSWLNVPPKRVTSVIRQSSTSTAHINRAELFYLTIRRHGLPEASPRSIQESL